MKTNILKMSKKNGSLFLIFFVISLYVQAQPFTDKLKRSVDSLANSEVEKQNIPGLSVVVVKDGKTDYIKGYGYSNLEHKAPVKPETIFQTASIGKQFTAFAVMLLVQDGKLSLDDKLTKFFPDAPAGWVAGFTTQNYQMEKPSDCPNSPKTDSRDCFTFFRELLG